MGWDDPVFRYREEVTMVTDMSICEECGHVEGTHDERCSQRRQALEVQLASERRKGDCWYEGMVRAVKDLERVQAERDAAIERGDRFHKLLVQARGEVERLKQALGDPYCATCGRALACKDCADAFGGVAQIANTKREEDDVWWCRYDDNLRCPAPAQSCRGCIVAEKA